MNMRALCAYWAPFNLTGELIENAVKTHNSKIKNGKITRKQTKPKEKQTREREKEDRS